QLDWKERLQLIQRWVGARPRSVTAKVTLAEAYLFYAWDARGHGYSDTVSDNGWKLFGDRVAQGKEILKQASSLSQKCPESYLVMQLVAQSEGWSKADARALFEKAFSFEPDYYYYSRMMAGYMLPKWGGAERDTENFTQEVGDRGGGDKGDILYFQIATNVICGCDHNPKLSWPRITRGFSAAEKKYGASMENLNLISFLATRPFVADPIIAQKAMTRMGDQVSEEIW